MLLTGFDSLVFQEKTIDFDELEKKYKIRIPYTYKLFVCSFKLGEDSLRKEYYWNTKKDLKSPLLSYYFGEGSTYISVEDFVSFPEAIELRETDADQFSNDNLGMMRIAFTNDAGGGGVYIGMKEDNFGKVYKASWDFLNEEDGLIEIAQTIFDFVYGLKSVLNSFDGVDTTKLYKNWGEDFWRVRE